MIVPWCWVNDKRFFGICMTLQMFVIFVLEVDQSTDSLKCEFQWDSWSFIDLFCVENPPLYINTLAILLTFAFWLICASCLVKIGVWDEFNEVEKWSWPKYFLPQMALGRNLIFDVKLFQEINLIMLEMLRNCASHWLIYVFG